MDSRVCGNDDVPGFGGNEDAQEFAREHPIATRFANRVKSGQRCNASSLAFAFAFTVQDDA